MTTQHQFNFEILTSGASSKHELDTNIFIRNSSLYRIVEGKTWKEAESNAQKLGGNLVAINSAEENKFIWETFKSPSWIGLTDSKSEGTWQWSNGDPVTYTNWSQDNPNNAGNEQHYGWFWGKSMNGQWDDVELDGRGEVQGGIAEIKLGSDFSISGSAKLTVNPVNDVATGEPWIEIHCGADDVVSTASDPLGVAHIVGEASLLSTEGSNPDEISTVGDVLAGSISSDSMIGSKANDLLIGSIAKAESAQVDVLTGKGGSDVFVLGNEEQSFYAAQGMNDYANITDFDPTQDQLQLNGDSSYFTAVVEHPDVTGTGIFRSADGKTAGDELIAVLSNDNKALEINRDDFKLV